MKISLEWLNSYLDTPSTAEEAASILTDIGFPIEEQQPLSSSDVLLDVEITSNRPDLLSHVGVARELAAASNKKLVRPEIALVESTSLDATSQTSVKNDATDLCPLYTARVIRGVTVGVSPDWLVNRLEAIGLRSVNNVVDITNFVLMELGQPLHAFDLIMLAEKRIWVRRAKANEAFVAIDGSNHQLRPDMLVIADALHPVAVAGVMGGLDSEVSEQTTDLLLESAQFDPLSVRQTSRTLKLFSESSFRFERGVDFRGVETASERAACLIREIAGGEIAQGLVQVGIDPPTTRTVAMRPTRCNQIIGIDIPTDRMIEMLDRLGLRPQLDKSNHSIICSIASHRLDLRREIDLIEEVARLYNYDRIETQDQIHIVARRVQPIVEAKQVLSQVLTAHGYHETVTFSTVSEARGRPFLPDSADPMMIADERRKAEPMLRPSLLPSLLTCRKNNEDVGNTDARLYETAAVWWRSNGRAVEHEQLGMLCDFEDPSETLRDLRGTVEELIERIVGDAPITFDPIRDTRLSEAAAVMAAGRLADTGGRPAQIGVIGYVAAKSLEIFEIRSPVAVGLLMLDAIFREYPPPRPVAALARFPGIERDLSIVVAEDVTWQQIAQSVYDERPPLMERLTFRGVYRGKPITEGRKSVTFRVLFRDPSGTLRHEQVDPQMAALADRLRSTLSAEIRQ